MAFCHECGSEVAEIDVFCPFCGISLEPVSLGGEEAEDAYANTIAISQGENPFVDQIVAPGSDSAGFETPLYTGPESENEKQEASETGSSQNTQPESGSHTFDDIPTPIFIEKASAALRDLEVGEPDTESPQGNAVSAETGAGMSDTFDMDTDPDVQYEAVQEELPPGDEIQPVLALPEEALPLLATDGTEASEGHASGETPNPEEALAEENETFQLVGSENLNDNAAETGDEVCGEELEEIVLQPETRAADVSDEQPVPELKEEEKYDPREMAKSSGDLYSEIRPFPDKGISRPLESLDSPPASYSPSAEYSSPSMFDSVRIMDSDPKNPESSKLIDPIVTGDVPAQQVVTGDPEKGPQSYTTPNFAKNDTDGRKSAKLRPLDEGTVLNNRYEIIRKIGGGGMGAVYLASDNNLGGVLRAVKEMVQAHIEEEQQEKAINDFKRESMILSTLDHPSIPTIYDYFFDQIEGRFYLVMKYISGGDLASRLRSAPEGRIEEATITEWAIQVADVLDYLHNRPSTIVYRDLKPSNVMLDGNTGRVMLIDFGIARSINQVEEKGVTAVGTMGYAPPELFSGNVEPRSDIYSLGSTMFHLLTGADPQNNPLLIFDFQKNPRPRQINPQLSDQIERILMHTVEYNATSRFGTAAELRKVLQEHLENLKSGRVTYGVKEIPTSVSLANQPVFCGFCGQKIVATDMFCAFCGAKQPLAQQGVHSEIYARSAPTARLMVIGTNELDIPAFTLEKDESLVGRRDPMSNIFPEIDLSKFDPQTKISRRHAKIWRDGNSYLVEDLGSSNGTILLPVVNDTKRLPPHQPHILTNGDKIRLGDTTLHFVIG